MPELPEVETIKRDLNKELSGRKIIGLKFYDWPKMLQPSPKIFKSTVQGKTIKEFGRRAKLLLLFLTDGVAIAIHLKMSGQLFIRNQKDPADRFTHIILELDKGQELRFNDLRKFGYMKVISSKNDLSEILSKYGPEPLTSEFTQKSFDSVISNSSQAIKKVIMDQSKISGVGNIYADEALWIAQIHPETQANTLDQKKLKKLFKAIEEVIKQGIEDRGTSVDQYFDAKGEKGSHSQNLKVFRQDKLPCLRCATIIKKIRVGGRGTHFCPKCQRGTE